MKLGILEADYVDEQAKKINGSYAEMFIKLLAEADENLEFGVYAAYKNEFPENINECDAYLITGSKVSVYDEDKWIKDEYTDDVSIVIKTKNVTNTC